MSVNSRAHVVDETNLFTSELGVIQEHQSSKSKMDVFNIEGGAGAGIDNAIHGTVSDLQQKGQTKTPKGSKDGSSTPNSQSTYRQRAHSSPDRSHNRSSNSVVSPRTNGSYRVGAKGQSPTQHSNPHALHSIRYNIAHKLSEGQDFTSSGAKILVVGAIRSLVYCVVLSVQMGAGSSVRLPCTISNHLSYQHIIVFDFFTILLLQRTRRRSVRCW